VVKKLASENNAGAVKIMLDILGEDAVSIGAAGLAFARYVYEYENIK